MAEIVAEFGDFAQVVHGVENGHFGEVESEDALHICPNVSGR